MGGNTMERQTMDLVNFTFTVGAEGIARLVWDMPGRAMNVITYDVIEELDRIIDHVAATPEIKGCVIASGKDAFSGGADLSMLQAGIAAYGEAAEAGDEEEALRIFFEKVGQLSLVYRKLEICGKPFAAAINGVCLGGAFELALACHYRVMADSEKTRVGLPEIKLGLFPGAGGTQRVARLMPTGDALQMLFKGEQIRAKAAKTMNLVHEVAPAEEIVAKAEAFIAHGGKGIAAWDEKGFRPPSGQLYSPQGMMIWPAANAIYRRETFDNYPAAKAILHAVYEGLLLPMDAALRVETRWFVKILRTPEAAAMIRTLFISMGALNKGARRPPAVPASNIRKVGILGAGFMGSGIAYVSANAGMNVVLIDRDQDSADKGKDHSAKLITGQILKGRASNADREALLSRIEASADITRLADCDLVIEAVFEDRIVKAAAIGAVQAAIGPQTILASNTSTLPIDSLAAHFARPENFIGIHFFSPVEKMQLVEIILGKATSERALALAFDYARALKKTPIVVHDGRGFYANRCVGAYLREGHLMLSEGVPPAMIETVARMAGMPVGPLALTDEVAIDLVHHILAATKREVGADAIDPAQEALIDAMVVTHGRFGRKNGKGFYDYPEKAKKRLWPDLTILQAHRLSPDGIDIAMLKHRFLAAQALEAARTLEEGILVDPREADVGSIIGFGFAPFTGGTLSYIDGMGVANFVVLCDELMHRHGSRFRPPQLLVDMAKAHETFYGRFASKVPVAA